MYRDRRHAGRVLAESLMERGVSATLVLALPRGGVVVGDEVARALQAPLDIVLARKIGAPSNPELAVAAVAADGTLVADPLGSGYVRLDPDYVASGAERETAEIARRLERYRGGAPPPSVSGQKVVVVDDGIATGLTITAALRYLRRMKPERLVLAVPVAPGETVTRLREEADAVVCPSTPAPFFAVGQFYERFDQTGDDEVVEILRSYLRPAASERF